MRHRFIIVNDKMQRGYRYELSARLGRDFDSDFRPDLTPMYGPAVRRKRI